MVASSRRRVSYVIPPPTDPVPRLQLPPRGLSRHGSTGPYLIPSQVFVQSPENETPAWAKHPRHRLGVASLAIDTSTHLAGRGTPEGILYTGGRDGLVISWDLDIPMKRRVEKQSSSTEALRRSVGRWEIMTGWGDDVIDEEAEDGEDRPTSDGDILGDVKESGGRRRKRSSEGEHSIPLEQQWETDVDAFRPGRPTQFRQCAQMHADWVNDLLLCNYNQTVVSASSDGTIKSWSPHASTPTDPSTIGSHTDYVRCLTHCREQNWIASGSFDRTVKLWDLGRTSPSPDALMTLNPPDASAPKSSVYAIAADPFGHTIASGSPERVVRLWDPRSGKRTGKLVGHTDNIRAILLSEDARYLLTGSADASIKLWSLASQRCLHTFTHHTDSVWSLFSTHPSLQVFYSGDKSGLVCKVDVEDCSDVSEGECIVLCQDSGERTMASSEGVNKIVAMDDNLLWVASGSSSIKRWRVPQRRSVRASSFVADIDAERERERSTISDSVTATMSRRRTSNSGETAPRTPPRSATLEPRTSPALRNSLSASLSGSDNWMPQRDREDDATLYGIPFQSLVRLTSPNDPFIPFPSRGRDPDVATLYSAASVMSVPRATVRSPIHAVFQHTHRMPSGSPMRSDVHSRAGGEDTSVPVNTARMDFEERELASDAVPLHTVPDDIIHGDSGLVRSIILNDRIHALTVDTAGEVAVWDIVRGVCRGRFPPQDVAAASHSGSNSTRTECERERSPRESLEAVRERIEGEAVVSPWSSVDTKTGVLTVHVNEKCFEAEIYADEAGFSDRHFGEELKLNIGKWVLRNLFLGFIREEQRTRRKRDSFTHDDVLHTMHRGNAPTHIELSSNNRHRRSSSNSSRRTEWSGSSSIVISSPNIIPAVSPTVVFLPRTSPLLTPMIALHPTGRDHVVPLPSIPQSPMAALNSNDATPIARPRRSQAVENVYPGGSIGSRPSTSRDNDYFSVSTRQSSGSGVIPSDSEDFSGWGGPGKVGADSAPPPTPSTPSGGGLMGRLKSLGKSSTIKKPSGEPSSPMLPGHAPGNVAAAEDTSTSEPSATNSALQALLTGHLSPPPSSEAPTLPLSPTISILISEEASPGWTTIYRGTVATSSSDIRVLEKAMPMWLLEYLLTNKSPPIAVNKVSFVLLPWPNKDPDEEKLPELLNTAQSKLTASRFLRVRKLTVHVQDKLDKLSGTSTVSGTPRSSVESHPASSKNSRPKAEDLYEILCNDIVLPLDMSLAAVRQFIWRQASELTMYYRRKATTSPSQQDHWPQDGMPTPRAL